MYVFKIFHTDGQNINYVYKVVVKEKTYLFKLPYFFDFTYFLLFLILFFCKLAM